MGRFPTPFIQPPPTKRNWNNKWNSRGHPPPTIPYLRERNESDQLKLEKLGCNSHGQPCAREPHQGLLLLPPALLAGNLVQQGPLEQKNRNLVQKLRVTLSCTLQRHCHQPLFLWRAQPSVRWPASYDELNLPRPVSISVSDRPRVKTPRDFNWVWVQDLIPFFGSPFAWSILKRESAGYEGYQGFDPRPISPPLAAHPRPGAGHLSAAWSRRAFPGQGEMGGQMSETRCWATPTLFCLVHLERESRG